MAIAGIIGPGNVAETRELTEQMVKCMMHGPSDTYGSFSDEKTGLALSWVHRPENGGGGQLVWNEAKNVGLLFFGEDFSELSGQGSEASVTLLKLYETLGAKMVERLNGWFSGVLVDLREGKILLFNDRYGLNRIYFHENGKGLYFASEAKSILKVHPRLRQLDQQSLGEFFSCGCVLQNRSLFSGISLLPGASLWTFHRDGKVTRGSYFSGESWENQSPVSDALYYEKLKETFTRVLPRYLRGKGQIAASLTGGLDGRMIMACAPSGPGELPCYTFGSSYGECADEKLAKEVACACQQPHSVIRVGEEFLANFPSLAEKTVYLTDGTMDVSGAAELYVNRLGRKIAPIRLTGNYGSEILRNNVAFRPRAGAEVFLNPDFTAELQKAAVTYAEEADGNRRSFIAFKQVPWHHYSRFCLEQSQIKVRSPFLDNELVALAFQRPADLDTSVEPTMRLVAECKPRLGTIPTDRGLVYPARSSRNRFRKAAEEFLIKAEYAYDYGMPHWLAKMDRVVAPLKLERLFLGRQKFCHYRTWYRHQLAPYIRQVLLDKRSLSRPFLNGQHVEAMVRGHTSGTRNHTTEIHKLLTVELMQRQFIDEQ